MTLHQQLESVEQHLKNFEYVWYVGFYLPGGQCGFLHQVGLQDRGGRWQWGGCTLCFGLVGRSQGCAPQHCLVATRERSSWMLTTKKWISQTVSDSLQVKWKSSIVIWFKRCPCCLRPRPHSYHAFHPRYNCEPWARMMTPCWCLFMWVPSLRNMWVRTVFRQLDVWFKIFCQSKSPASLGHGLSLNLSSMYDKYNLYIHRYCCMYIYIILYTAHRYITNVRRYIDFFKKKRTQIYWGDYTSLTTWFNESMLTLARSSGQSPDRWAPCPCGRGILRLRRVWASLHQCLGQRDRDSKWMFPKIVDVSPKSSILIGFSSIFTIHFNRVFQYFHHPFWGKIPIFGNT